MSRPPTKSYIPVYNFILGNENAKAPVKQKTDFLRKTQSEENFLENKPLSIHNKNIADDDKEIYKANLRKSMDSVSKGAYEPVYKNYRYQPRK